MIKLEKQEGQGEGMWQNIERVRAELADRGISEERQLCLDYAMDVTTHPYTWRATVRLTDLTLVSFGGDLPDSTPSYRGPLAF